MKILIIANNQKWKSWDKKIKELKDWFLPALEIEFTIIHTKIKDVPFVDYGVFDGIMRKGIDKNWYNENITKKYPEYDFTILSMNREDWGGFPVEGWQWDGKCIALASNEKGSYNFKGVRYTGEKWFNIARHEICHALYIKQGKTDNTHKYWDTGVLEQVLVELKPQLMNPTYRYFKPKEIINLKHELVSMLDEARHLAQIPFKINSGYRTPDENKKAGGEPNSAHLRGLAADIACSNSASRYKIINAALKVGFTRIGIGKTYIHLDCDKSLPQGVVWHYYK